LGILSETAMLVVSVSADVVLAEIESDAKTALLVRARWASIFSEQANTRNNNMICLCNLAVINV
jgi:hypothetical protein